MKSDLTILLILKDRVPFTWRWLAYMDQIKFPYSIYIADGGADESVPKALADKSRYPNISYDYVRYPFDKSYSEYYKKMADALGRIETAFVAISDNDDFCVVDGLARSVEFLKAHPDYSACRGEVGGFNVLGRGRDKYMNAVYGEIVDLHTCYGGSSNEEATAAARVAKMARGYDPVYYDVQRTAQMKKCFEALAALDPQNIYIAEIMTGMLAVAEGRIKRLPSLSYLRQRNTPETSNKTEVETGLDFFDRMLLGSWSHDFTGFAEAVARSIAERDGLPFPEALELVKKTYKKIVANNIIGSMSERTAGHPAGLLRRAFNKVLSTAARPYRRGRDRAYAYHSLTVPVKRAVEGARP